MRRAIAPTAIVAAALACDDPDPRLAVPNPDDEAKERVVKEELERSPEAVDKLCGAAGSKLTDVRVELLRSITGTVAADVSGTAGGVRCEGSVIILLAATEGAPGFEVRRFEVAEVRTKGHEWKRPAASARP